MAEKNTDPRKDKAFKKVVERMLKTPPKPHVKKITPPKGKRPKG